MAIETNSRSRGPACPIHLFEPAFIRDPHPGYRLLRETVPVSWNSAGFWVVVRYDDILSLLRDPRCDHWGQEIGGSGSTMESALGSALQLLSPRAASSLRRPVATGLAGSLDSAATAARNHADYLLQALRPRDQIELMADYAHPFTFGVISRTIGIPDQDMDFLSALIASLDGHFLSCVAPGALPSGPREAALQFISYLRDLIRFKQHQPEDDLLSRLLHAGTASPEQMVPLLVLLFYAGHQNMMNFIGNALIALARWRGCMAAVRNSPELLARSVSELLRYDSPVLYIALVAREMMVVRGCTIAPREVIFAGVSAANRDPLVFPDPDKLDFDRTNSRHLAFGDGLFRCLGARLAELEGAIALSRFLAHIAEFHIEEEAISWRSSPVVQRGPASVPMEVRSYARAAV